MEEATFSLSTHNASPGSGELKGHHFPREYLLCAALGRRKWPHISVHSFIHSANRPSVQSLC